MLKSNNIKHQDLLSWCKEHGEYGQYLLEEWTGALENGEQISADKIARGSGKRAVWKCSYCGEEFICPLSGRTGKKTKRGCPHCNTHSTSYPEQFIYNAVKMVAPDSINRGKIEGYEFDIVIPSLNTNIEYSPTYTHKEKTERDEEKAKLCRSRGIRFINIIEDSHDELSHYVRKNSICFHLDYGHKYDSLCNITNALFKLLNINTDVLDYTLIDEIAFMRSHHRIPFDESVVSIFPDLMLEWNYDYNGGKNPCLLTPFVQEKFFWLCNECNYGRNGEWQAVLSNRTNLKQGCPACGYNWYDKKIHNNAQPITIVGRTDFPSLYPELFKEWNEDKNCHIDPTTLRGNSHKRVYWTCRQCGYGEKGEWRTAITTRTADKTGCPACGYNCFDGTYHITSGTSAVVQGKTDLETLFPGLAKEWFAEMNYPLEPSKVKPKSKQKTYWICGKCGYGNAGEWKVSIGSRTADKTGCPACGYNCFTDEYKTSGSQVVIEGVNDLASSEYNNIVEEWHPTLNKISPKGIKPSTHAEVYWQCVKCGYGQNGEWMSTVNSRTNQKSGCPVCGYNYYDQTYHKTTGRGTVLKGVNDLMTTHPEYAREWHPRLNTDINPDAVKAGSHREVFWRCPSCGYGENGEWYQDIHDRLRRGPLCNNCRKRKRKYR